MKESAVKDELRQLFHILREQDYCVYQLKEIDAQFPAFWISEGIWKGVAIPIENKEIIKQDFLANFENIKLCIKNKRIENRDDISFLTLLSKKENAIDKFILLCIDFIEPRENGKNRKELLNNPQKWVNKWKDLLGNKSENDMDYSYLGELIILNYLMNNHEEVYFTNQGSHDIETNERSYEVKTTIMRYTSNIEIHSQYQLETTNNNPLELYFVRLEESMQGVSINSILQEIQQKRSDIEKIKNKVEGISTESREKKYKILEVRSYNVDETFPKITVNSFKQNMVPENITNVKYTIDLEGLKYKNIQI